MTCVVDVHLEAPLPLPLSPFGVQQLLAAAVPLNYLRCLLLSTNVSVPGMAVKLFVVSECQSVRQTFDSFYRNHFILERT